MHGNAYRRRVTRKKSFLRPEPHSPFPVLPVLRPYLPLILLSRRRERSPRVSEQKMADPLSRQLSLRPVQNASISRISRPFVQISSFCEFFSGLSRSSTLARRDQYLPRMTLMNPLIFFSDRFCPCLLSPSEGTRWDRESLTAFGGHGRAWTCSP